MALPIEQTNEDELVTFSDPNFKLAIMESLITSKRLNLGTVKELTERVLKRNVEIDETGFELNQQVYKFLIHYPITKKELESVEAIVIDADSRIYEYIFPFWNGWSDDFDIQSLDDIALCPNLEDIDIMAMVNDGDLSALSTLKKLRRLSLSFGPSFSNIDVLLTLPDLEQFQYFSQSIEPKYIKIIEELGKRGVEIHVFK